MTEATVHADRDSLSLALDALIETAVRHIVEDARIELSGAVTAGTWSWR